VYNERVSLKLTLLAKSRTEDFSAKLKLDNYFYNSFYNCRPTVEQCKL